MGLPGEERRPTEWLEPAAQNGSDTGIEHAYLWGIIDPEQARSLTRVTLKAEKGGEGTGQAENSLSARKDHDYSLPRSPSPGARLAKPTGWARERLGPFVWLEPDAPMGPDIGLAHAFPWGITGGGKALSRSHYLDLPGYHVIGGREAMGAMGPGAGEADGLKSVAMGSGGLAKGARDLIKGAVVSPSIGGHGDLVDNRPLAKGNDRPGISPAIPPPWAGPSFSILNPRVASLRRVRGVGKVSIADRRNHDSFKYKITIGDFDGPVSHDVRLVKLNGRVGPSP
jgi:hypothetical protein